MFWKIKKMMKSFLCHIEKLSSSLDKNDRNDFKELKSTKKFKINLCFLRLTFLLLLHLPSLLFLAPYNLPSKSDDTLNQFHFGTFFYSSSSQIPQMNFYCVRKFFFFIFLFGLLLKLPSRETTGV